MKMNSDKCHLILSSNDENKKIELNGEAINNTQVQKLLGVHIDYKLKFDTHIESQVAWTCFETCLWWLKLFLPGTFWKR